MHKLLAIAEAMFVEKVVLGNWPVSQKSKVGLVLIAVSGILAAVAGGFVILAFNIWVKAHYAPDIAALVTAGGIFALALAVALSAYGVLHQRHMRAQAFKNDIKKNIEAAIGLLDDELGDHIRANPHASVILASLAGYIVADKIL